MCQLKCAKQVPDVVATNSGQSNDRSTQNLSILLGNADGTLQTAQTLEVPGRPLNSVTGDFNGDGKRDIAVLNRRDESQLTIFLGDGQGNFKTTRSTKLGKFRTDRIVAADFNRDGRTDIAVLTDETVSVLLGLQQGTLQLKNRFLSVDPFRSEGNLITGDMNGDGRLDLITTSADVGSTTVGVSLGNGKGNFSRTVGFSAQVDDDRSDMSNAYDIVQGDFNGDGKFDLATADGFSYYSGGTVTVFINTTTGQDAIGITDFSVDGSIARSGSLNVDLGGRKLAYNGPQAFRTSLNRFVTTVIGTIGNDKIRGGKFNDFLNGYDGNDVIIGSNGKDRLIGGAGKDKLTGGNGRDRFIFSNTPNYPEGLNRVFDRSRMGVDRIVDFQPGEDKIILDGGTFTALKQRIRFASVDDERAAETHSAILTYDRSTGSLYYNANGSASGFGNGGLFAILENVPRLGSKDFSVFL